ncbi:PepSY-associated TM helix domain-containing protein [Caldimonas caldifontis]|uniref:Peptidase n=1 Tax=Caldimonas caldifontis TaxID=1452508 RepID=A0A2S5SXN7_9BURK|nr:PepSY-associated TM helix domain-containing protein [Caldimonas caldifontis]PPE67535.1 hypothetical protein C1704_05125 [Caldimonas caldifontis]
MTRHFWVLAHRCAGLAIAGFLVIAGLTGSLLAFYDEIDTALNPELMLVEDRSDVPLLDPLVLRERVEQALPGNAHLDYHPLHRDEGRSHKLYAWRLVGPEGAQKLRFYEVFANPYTAEVLGERERGAWVFDRAHFMPLMYQLHYALTIPYPWGMWLFGVISFVWLFDSFVGFYLTLPRRRNGFWKGWKPAWLVKWSGSAYRINFDLHRALSLWLWGMLILFAVSSVSLNLKDELYLPVLKRIVPTVDAHEALPDLHHAPLMQANMSWEQARERGRELMAARAARHGFVIEQEDAIMFAREHGAWYYSVMSDQDFADDHGHTVVYFSAQDDHGAELAFEHPKIAPGNTFTSWLAALHMGKVFGLPYRLLVLVMGLVIAVLSITGVVIWWRKRRGRRAVPAEAAAPATPAPRMREDLA